MQKIWGLIFIAIFIGSLTVVLSADPSFDIRPEIAYQDMPVVVDYTDFSNGDYFEIDYELSYPSENASTLNGITDGFLLYPFKLEDGQINAFSGSMSVNGKPVVSGHYSELHSDGILSFSLTQVEKPTGENGTVSFQFSGIKISGDNSGTINLLPIISPEKGEMNVSATIGGSSVSRKILFNQAISSPEKGDESKELDMVYGIMKQTPKQMREEMRSMLSVPILPDNAEPIEKSSKSILSSVPYVPAERNQGNCGNCWVWAATGVVETAHTLQDGVKDRLSIQYLNSNYNGGTGPNWACEGGSATTFAQFYSDPLFDQAIPWSNTNAAFYDAKACPSGDCSKGTKMPASQISGEPNYPVLSISAYQIGTQTVDQAQAIANLKAQINANKALYYGFRLPTNTAWREFSNFWATQPESVLWNPDPYNGALTDGGGHGVLLVGYNDNSANPDEWYWEVLNSWGSSASRPNGLFRLKMNMNYAGMGAYYNHYFNGLDVKYSSPPPTPPKILRINPISGNTGTTIQYTITGTNFKSGDIVNLSHQNQANITSVSTLTGVALTGSFIIPTDAAAGPWKVCVNQNGLYSNDDVIFTITEAPMPAPVVQSISPDTGDAGASIQYTITGTSFAPGAFVNLTNEGQPNITSIADLIGADLSGTFKIPTDAAAGPWKVCVNQNGTYSNEDIMFIITTGPIMAPIVTGISPDSGQNGTSVQYSITGYNFESQATVNLTNPGQENISSIGYQSGANMAGTFTLPVDVLTGPWNVSVNQNGLYSNDNILFTITEGPAQTPVIHKITPNTGLQGETTDYLVQGQNFLDAGRVNLSSPNQTNISSITNLSGVNLTGTVSIPDDAVPGSWNVTVNQNGLCSNDDVQFVILPSGPFPVVTSISMSFVQPGKGSGFVVYGSNFENGDIVNLSHPGQNTITAIGELSKEKLIGTFAIPASCIPGLWNVTVNQKGKLSNDNVQFPIKGKPW